MSRLERIRKKDSVVHSRTEQEREPIRIPWFKWVIFLAVIGLIIYALLFSKIFEVREVVVSGYSHPEKVEELIGEQLGHQLIGNNILFFRAVKTEEAVLGDPTVEMVRIKKIFPSKIKVEVTETKPAIIWVSAGDNYLINDRGVVIGNARDEKLTKIFDAANLKAERGDRVASPTFIKFITKTAEVFEPACGTKISKILIFDILSDVRILTSDGWTVYLDANKDPESQMSNLTKVLAEARKEKSKFSYIDLRLHNKAFYK